ncbi:MAG: UDP-N-acetylglucosamine pyrophosphorylase [Clostridia bacterium]|nr:UDP-N-acetylglucosamine pyrophosphorylase [Clostridia bacterium]
MALLTVKDLFDLSHTLAKEYLSSFLYPHEALKGLKEEIARIGATLSPDEYDFRGDFVWVAKSASVMPTAYVGPYTIIGAGTEVRHCAFIRGAALIGEGVVVGNSTEIKNAVIFDGVQIPHYNYVGDSVLGYKSHMGAGSIASNFRSDKGNIAVYGTEGERAETGLRKIGTMLGDYAEIGCNSVLCPGSIVGRGAIVYPLSRVRGVIPANHIFKGTGSPVPKK